MFHFGNDSIVVAQRIWPNLLKLWMFEWISIRNYYEQWNRALNKSEMDFVRSIKCCTLCIQRDTFDYWPRMIQLTIWLIRLQWPMLLLQSHTTATDKMRTCYVVVVLVLALVVLIIIIIIIRGNECETGDTAVNIVDSYFVVIAFWAGSPIGNIRWKL